MHTRPYAYVLPAYLYAPLRRGISSFIPDPLPQSCREVSGLQIGPLTLPMNYESRDNTLLCMNFRCMESLDISVGNATLRESAWLWNLMSFCLEDTDGQTTHLNQWECSNTGSSSGREATWPWNSNELQQWNWTNHLFLHWHPHVQSACRRTYCNFCRLAPVVVLNMMIKVGVILSFLDVVSSTLQDVMLLTGMSQFNRSIYSSTDAPPVSEIRLV